MDFIQIKVDLDKYTLITSIVNIQYTRLIICFIDTVTLSTTGVHFSIKAYYLVYCILSYNHLFE